MLYAFAVKFCEDWCYEMGTHFEIFSQNSTKSCAFSTVEQFEMFEDFLSLNPRKPWVFSSRKPKRSIDP